MKREDYVFTIGFDGSKAIVDKRSRAMYKNLNTRALADKGLYRAAYRSAVFDGDTESAGYVLKCLNAVSTIQYAVPGDLDKVFGVQAPSDDITGIRAI